MEPCMVSEPISVTTSSSVTEISPCVFLESTRTELNRAITGEELLNRLRPRIKSLF